ncbi:hypothetical protein E1H18_3648 [Caulobacter sp. RHG1]|nr:hypothetical protein [Caulobacter sp. RHG1]
MTRATRRATLRPNKWSSGRVLDIWGRAPSGATTTLRQVAATQ